jgi:hypothetical protein
MAPFDFTLTADPTSLVALATALYSVWTTALKRADLKAFVPPTIRYASPYQNSNFEVFEIPVTVLNQGARTGTVLAMSLTVQAPGSQTPKRFYAHGTGSWTLDHARGGPCPAFSPIALAGRASQSSTVLFYARGDETVMQVVEATGDYKLTLAFETALARDNGWLARWFQHRMKPMTFIMRLPHLDHRAFTSGSGTLSLHHPNYATSS